MKPITHAYTKLYSFRFNCKIVSFTAAKTKRIFSVSRYRRKFHNQPLYYMRLEVFMANQSKKILSDDQQHKLGAVNPIFWRHVSLHIIPWLRVSEIPEFVPSWSNWSCKKTSSLSTTHIILKAASVHEFDLYNLSTIIWVTNLFWIEHFTITSETPIWWWFLTIWDFTWYTKGRKFSLCGNYKRE
jgi:hypothetical protein